MKKSLLILFLLPLLTFYANAQCNVSGVIISSILIDPNGPNFNNDTDGDGTAETEDEFVEICNTSAATVDIGGWTINDNSGAGPDFTFPVGTMLAPGECAILVQDWDPGTPPAGVFSRESGGGWLNNGGDNVFLSDGVTTCEVSYGSTSCTSGASCEDWGGDVDGCILTAVGPQCPLPVSLVNFDATLQNESVKLFWRTASEEDNDFFAIEHSTDGINYTEIDLVDGAGTSSLRNDYSYTHRFPAKGNNYYRLAQVDYNRRVSYSPVEVVALSKGELFSLFPTITNDKINLVFAEKLSKDAQIEVYNLAGQKVLQNQMEGGLSTSVLELADLQSGHYFVRIQEAGQVQSARFVKY